MEEVEEENSKDESEATNNKSLEQNSRRAFFGELRKVVERTDVILQVLDARAPLARRAQLWKRW